MKRVAVIVAVLAVAVVLYLIVGRNRDDVSAASGSAAAASEGSGSSSAIGGKRAAKLEHTTRVTPEEHRRMVDQIAAAHAEHAAHAAPAAPKLPEQGSGSADDLSRVQAHVLAALKEAIPFLAACYEQYQPDRAKPGITTVAQMTLTSDPDIGTVIDADQIFDDKHQPLDKKLDDCLRNTMQTLALPPLETGDTVRIEYSFRFGDDGK